MAGRNDRTRMLFGIVGAMIGVAFLDFVGVVSIAGSAPWDPIVRPGDDPYRVSDRQREANQFLDLVTWMNGPDGAYWHAASSAGIDRKTGTEVAVVVKKVPLSEITRFGWATIDFDERCLWKPERDCTLRGDGDVDLEDFALYMRQRSGEPEP